MPTQPKRRRRTKAQLETARRRREASRKHHLMAKHRMTQDQYDAILAIQNGMCCLCLRARGTTRALSVDHDHKIAREICLHPHEESCPACWRGLLCARCNNYLGHARDDIAFFGRAIDYLRSPPAQEVVRHAREGT